MHVIVTGGAGFIGSHLIDPLLSRGDEVLVYDNLSSGRMDFISHNLDDRNFTFVEGDLLDVDGLNNVMKGGFDAVWHLAANPDVRKGTTDTHVHVEQNIIATHNLLEAVRINKVPLIFFTSTSTVYGEADIIPTPEDYAPMKPISLYGASKLAAEALISSYCYTFDIESVIYRFANVVGPRSTHGVIYDFVTKLRADPEELEILGDGTQNKSYLFIDDCISSMLFGAKKRAERVEIYNIGSEDMTNVTEIADILVEEARLKDVKFSYTGGVDGGRGWKGDVKTMRLSIKKLVDMGWKPAYSSSESVRMTARHLIEELGGVNLVEGVGGAK